MHVCVYVCTYVPTYVCTYLCVQTYDVLCTYNIPLCLTITCIPVDAHTYVCICTYLRAYVRSSLVICTYMYVCANCILTYVHTYVRTYILIWCGLSIRTLRHNFTWSLLIIAQLITPLLNVVCTITYIRTYVYIHTVYRYVHTNWRVHMYVRVLMYIST